MVESLNYLLNARNGCDKISNQSEFWEKVSKDALWLSELFSWLVSES